MDARICIPHALWLRWLESGNGSLCGTWEGRWKEFSPPFNEPGPHPSSFQKPAVRIFRAERMPRGSTLWCDWRRRLEKAREQVHAWLSPHERTGTLTRLITGTRQETSQGDASSLLVLLGFIHLVNVSGIHLYVLARIWNGIFGGLAIRLGMPQRPARLGSGLATCLAWTGAWLLAGARPGMLRPWIVVSLRTGARRLGFRWRRFAPLAIALAVDLAVELMRGGTLRHDSGRWVYALACGGGLMARSAPGVALGAWVLAALWQGLREGVISTATPFLSAVSVPLFAAILYPLAALSFVIQICGLPELAGTMAHFCGTLSDGIVLALAHATLGLRTLWMVSAWGMCGGMALAALSSGARLRWRAVILALLVVLRAGGESVRSWADAPSHRGSAQRVEQLDIGQGDAALVAGLGGGAGLIDTGPERALSDAAWIELLARRGVKRIEWAALTHLDEDHSGGLKRLARLIPVRCVATARGEIESERGQAYKHALEALGIRVTDWSGDCVPYPALAPRPGDGGKANSNMGAVFVPLAGGGYYLSAGDADSEDEPRIGAWAAEQARVLSRDAPRILKISHHGSKTSSNPRFLALVKPTVAWISVGVGNRYGHPSMSVLDELDRLGLPVRRTDVSGCLSTWP